MTALSIAERGHSSSLLAVSPAHAPDCALPSALELLEIPEHESWWLIDLQRQIPVPNLPTAGAFAICGATDGCASDPRLRACAAFCSRPSSSGNF
jgi:hypothetical protein